MLVSLALVISGCDSPDAMRAGPNLSEPPTFPDGHFLASDLHGNSWFSADSAGATLDRFSLDAIDPVCQGEDHDPYCLLFQSHERTAWDEAAEVDFAWAVLDTEGGDDGREDLVGQLAGVDAETGATRWRVSNLDFSHWAGPVDCPYELDDPCHPSDSLTDREYHACRLWMPHDVAVVSETATSTRAWVADTRNNRLLELDIPHDDTCARVDSVIDTELVGWDVYDAPTSVEFATDANGIDTILFATKSSEGKGHAAEEQLSGSGKGKILLWENRGADWSQRWEFPPQVEGAESFVNSPHGATFAKDAAGDPLVIYAHSLGAAGVWGGDSGQGTIGVLKIDAAGGPAYVGDVRLPAHATLHFPRDVSPVGDAGWLVSDSGCAGEPCGQPTGAWMISVPNGDVSGASGAWSTDHENQVFLDAKLLAGPFFGSAQQLYSVDWVAE